MNELQRSVKRPSLSLSRSKYQKHLQAAEERNPPLLLLFLVSAGGQHGLRLKGVLVAQLQGSGETFKPCALARSGDQAHDRFGKSEISKEVFQMTRQDV